MKSWNPPMLPALHSPGWLLRYALGPYDWKLWGMLISDIVAGITVALTLVPQV